MTKAQIKAAQTIANDYSYKAGSVPGYFIDDEGNHVITDAKIVAIIPYSLDDPKEAPLNYTPEFLSIWKNYRKTLERTDSAGVVALTIGKLKGKPEYVRVNGNDFSTKVLRSVVRLCGGLCALHRLPMASSTDPQKFYGNDCVIGLVSPAVTHRELEVIK